MNIQTLEYTASTLLILFPFLDLSPVIKMGLAPQKPYDQKKYYMIQNLRIRWRICAYVCTRT